VPLGEALLDVARALGMEGPLRAVEILRVWPRAVGRTVAEHARPVGLQGGMLLVHVTDSAWFHRLSMGRRDIVRNVNDHLDTPAVKSLRLRIGPLEDAPGGSRAPAALAADGKAAGSPAPYGHPGPAPEDPAVGRALDPVKDLPFGDVVHRILRRQAGLGRRR
jgi:predicted nucleic acid-binding Zn ribbon protein